MCICVMGREAHVCQMHMKVKQGRVVGPLPISCGPWSQSKVIYQPWQQVSLPLSHLVGQQTAIVRVLYSCGSI